MNQGLTSEIQLSTSLVGLLLAIFHEIEVEREKQVSRIWTKAAISQHQLGKSNRNMCQNLENGKEWPSKLKCTASLKWFCAVKTNMLYSNKASVICTGIKTPCDCYNLECEELQFDSTQVLFQLVIQGKAIPV